MTFILETITSLAHDITGCLRASLKDLFKKSLHAACIMVTDEESGQKAWQLRDCCQRIDRHYQWRLCGSD